MDVAEISYAEILRLAASALLDKIDDKHQSIKKLARLARTDAQRAIVTKVAAEATQLTSMYEGQLAAIEALYLTETGLELGAVKKLQGGQADEAYSV